MSYRPADLRSLIRQSHAERKTVSVNNVERRARNGELVYLKIDVTPLQEGTDDIIGFCISFADITVVRNLENDMLRARHKAQTISEELQSANEELQTINEELRERTDELNNSNGFLNSILSSLRGGVAVVDRNINVVIRNRLAEDLWGAPIGGSEGSAFAPGVSR